MKRVICELPGRVKWCQIDDKGFGSCGDKVVQSNGTLCLWAVGPVEEGQDLTGDVSLFRPFPDAHPPSVLPEKGE